MKYVSYDRLVIVAGNDVLGSEQLRDLVALESKSGGSATTLAVDPFDFADCMTVVDKAIQSALGAGEVVVNISGGTKVLGDATLLAAFQNGVEAYHCDEKVVKLPVLKGVRFVEMLGNHEVRILETLQQGDTLRNLEGKIDSEEMSGPAIRKSVRYLERIGILHARLERGEARLYLAAGHNGPLSFIPVRRGSAATP